MSEFVLKDCTTWAAGYDMTTDLNKMTVKADVEDKESTTFGTGGWKSRVGGLRDFSLDLSGFWQSATSGAIDPEAWSAVGVADRVVSVSPTGVAGATCYMGQAGELSYEVFGQIGEITPFALKMMGTNKAGLVRGQIAAARGAVSATGAVGSGVQLGAVGAAQFLYAAVHVFAAGTTITLKIQSDDNAGFASPTDVTTLSAITTTGGVWVTRVPGPLTDTYFRFNASAITGSFTLAGAIGIGS